nr:MAG TPA: hypothetical protein [Caudoviricetes sp.]
MTSFSNNFQTFRNLLLTNQNKYYNIVYNN